MKRPIDIGGNQGRSDLGYEAAIPAQFWATPEAKEPEGLTGTEYALLALICGASVGLSGWLIWTVYQLWPLLVASL